MKRLQVRRALAIMTLGAASAQASAAGVKLGGELDVAAVRARTVGGPASVSSLDSGLRGPSHWELSGVEVLDPGWRALFKLDAAFAADSGLTGPVYWARESTVGLRTPLGTVRLGRNVNPLFDMLRDAQVFGESRVAPALMAVAHTTSHPLNAAQDNSLRWDSPQAPLTGSLLLRAAESAGSRYFSGQLRYRTDSNGPGFRVAADRSQVPGHSGALTSWLWGPQINFGPLRGSATFALQRDTDLGRKLSGLDLGFAWETPGGTLRGSLAHAQKSALDGSGASRITAWAAAWDAPLSLRTGLYLMVAGQRIGGLPQGRTSGAGFHHLF